MSKKYKLDNGCSFAYLKDGKVSEAIKKMVEYYHEGYKIILEADIKKFFDNVNRKKLLKQISADLLDKTIDKLIKDAMEQNIGDLLSYDEQYHHYFLDSIQGIAQGNPLSPLLANIYLAAFDQRMIAENMKLIRYADDFIVMCKNTEEANRALSIAKEEIEDRLKLELHPLPKPMHLETSKTRILDPTQHRFSFLSICFNGKDLWVKADKILDLRTKINNVTELSTYRNDPKYKGLITILQRLKNLLEGWLSAFKFVDIDRDFMEIDNHINYKLYTLLLRLDFKLKTNNINTKKIKSTGKEVQLLTPTQRNNIGVPGCKKFLDSINRELILK